MLTKYFEVAMCRAHYEQMNDGSWWGEIPGFDGLWAQALSPEACVEELRSTLEDWVLVGVYLHHNIPIVDGIDLNVKKAA